MKDQYTVTYKIKKAAIHHDEISGVETEVKYMESPTDELRVVLTDLFDLHQGYELMGIEILKIQPVRLS